MLEAEKRAFLARAAGRALTAPFRGAANTYWRAAQNAPGTTLMATALPIALAPTMMQEDPAAQQEKQLHHMRRRQLAAAAGGLGMKTASVHFDESEVREALAIRRGLEKTASRKPVNLQTLMTRAPEMFSAGLMLGAGMGVAGAGTAAAAYGAGRLTEMARAGGREKRFVQMLKADPTLKQHPQVRAYFNILDKASPYIAGEPHVAASTVRTMLESPEGYGTSPKQMRDILEVEKKRQDTRFPALRAPTFKAELPELD